MAEAAVYNERAAKSGALSPAFTAPAEFSLDNHSPASALSELDGSLEFDGLGLGPELQFLLDQHLAESPMASDSHLLDNMDKVLSSPDLQPLILPNDPFTTPTKNRTVVNIHASSVGGPALPSLSTCSTDSRQDYVSTIESRSRGGRPPRRAAAAAALEHNHFVFGSPSPNGATDASPSPVQTKTPQEALDDEDAAMDFDLLDSDAEKKVGQKRPRRRVIVETKDANGRAYSAAEIRRMKRRITNRESARRMRLKRQEEWAAIKRQARGMREQVQSMSGKVAALQAHCGTLQGEAERWQALWRQAAAANSQLTQRAAAGADSQAEGHLVGIGEGHSLTDEVHVDAMLKDPSPKDESMMARAHSCAVPAASAAHPVFSLPQSLAHRRAASTPEALPDFLLAASMPAELSRMEDADGMTGALAALEEEARAFEDKFDEEAFASFLEM
ncbi:hypothetical protein CVIRNUC_005576 [Coccomyxa viridis]|uniref:BZIP domain-containing protein n=1 Tax=Coccomyxa viridis TaxID=1274662 RepID=A0AAV1I830_9CHLO|nr:hypothetical protein CVIRNUC_005576 [Coccomyxa viridis]